MRHKPGNRKDRWRQSCNTEAIILVGLGALVLISSPTNLGNIILASVFGIGAWLAWRSAKKGWPISYELPPSHYWQRQRAVTRGDWDEVRFLDGVANDTLAEGQDPNRPRYAFEHPEWRRLANRPRRRQVRNKEPRE